MIKPRSPTLQADSLPSEPPGKPTTTITHFKNIYILPNQPTLSLSHRVQKTVLYISFSFVVSYTGLLGRPRGMVWGGRREEGSPRGTNVYLWRIHFDIWQNQYNIVNLKNKIKKKYIFSQELSHIQYSIINYVLPWWRSGKESAC